MRFNFIEKHSTVLLLSAISLLIGVAGQAQTLSIVSGNGQLIPNGSPATLPLVVQLLDASGKPFANQTIVFTNSQNGAGGGINGNAMPTTDISGLASVQFVGANLNNTITSASFVQTNILATFGTATATFTETTSAQGPGGGLLVQVNLLSPAQGQVLTGSAGSAGSIPIRVLVGTLSSNAGVPNVAVTISADSNGSISGTISCKEGAVVYTDNTGTATCTPVFGKTGSGTFTVTVGGGAYLFPLNQFVVTVGPPGIISVTAGDNQTGLPGQTLPLPIVAVVTDLAGNILSGAAVVFESVTPGGVTFTNTRTSSDANGRVSTSVILGGVAGPVQIRIRDVGNLVASPAIVTATVNITISGLTKISGDNQIAFINSAFALLSVRVTNTTGGPVASSTVTFAVTSGSATLLPSTAVTDASGNASTTVTAGPSAGPITVTATVGALTQTFSLTANPPGPTNFSYFNGASFENGKISPGSIVTITALGLVTSNVQGVVGGTLFGVLPYTVAGVSVTIGGLPAPIFYVGSTNGQQSVTVQVPFEVPATTVPITISVTGGGSTSAFVTILPVAPGVFESAGTDNRKRVVALRPNGSVVTPANPAARGENVRVYLTGLGNVSPTVQTGSFSPSGPDPIVLSNLVVGIANNGAPLVQAIYARNLVGVYELTVTIPTDTAGFPSGTVAFSVAVQGPNGFVYSQSSLIAIQ
jgi:uncharacterized protein (TIGR03437 family)